MKFSKKVWIFLCFLLFAGVLSQAASTSTTTATGSKKPAAGATGASAAELSALRAQIQQLSEEFETYKGQVDSLEDKLITRLEKELDDRDYVKAACEASKVYWAKTVDFVKNLHDEVAQNWPGLRDEGLRLWNIFFTQAKADAHVYSDRMFDELVILGLSVFQAEIAVGVIWALAGGIVLLVAFTLIRLVYRIITYFLCCRFCRRGQSNRNNPTPPVKREPSAPTAQVPRSSGKTKKERKN